MNLNSFFIFTIFIVLAKLSFASVAMQESKLAVFDGDGFPLLPISTIDSNNIVNINGMTVDLNGIDDEMLTEKVRSDLGEEVGKVLRYTDKQLVTITVMGEIDNPGVYLQPKGTSVALLNYFNHLYDRSSYKASVVLFREGQRKEIDDQSKELKVKDGDVYTLSISPVEISPVKTSPVEISVDDIVKLDDSNDKKEKGTVIEQNLSGSNLNNSVLEKAPLVNMALQEVQSESQILLSENDSSVEGHGKDDRTNDTSLDQVSEDKSEDKSSSLASSLEGYIVQPGDIFEINLPGEEGFNKDFLVNRYGAISLPEVGNIEIAGLTIDSAEQAIYSALSNIYLGLDKLSVQLKAQRLLVTVLGYVESPGEVEIPSTGNIQTAINVAGGLQDGAQLNKFQLQRDDEIIEFNYKRYLDTGDSDEIPELASLDTIFVPSSPDLGNVHGDTGVGGAPGVDPTADRTALKVFGEVLRPGSFAYVEGMSIVDALLKAGGVSRYANYEQIRIIAEGEPMLFNLKKYLDGDDKKAMPNLVSGTTIFVPKQVDAISAGGRVVYVMGQVQKPGAFETGDKVGFMDVLANAGGPNRYADNAMVRILRADGSVEPFSLEAYTEGSDAKLPDIFPGDAIFLPQKSTLVDSSWLKLPTNSAVQMMGAVGKPGRYQWAEGINFMDMLSHAGGPTEKADMANVRVVSTGPNGEAISREFNMNKFLERGGSWDNLPSLKGGVTVVFPELPEDPSDNKSQWIRLSSEQAIYIMGAVVSPGRYAFSERLDILDILSAAEGPKEEADLTNVRVIHRNGPAPRVSQLNLVNYFESGDETMLPDVAPGDSIFIPSRNRSWVQKKNDETVRVFGAVEKTGRYDFSADMNILDILAETGGPTKTAYIEKITIINTSTYENKTHYFNLVEFMETPDATLLPVLRPGDTVFVPDVSSTKWAYIMSLLQQALSVTSVLTFTQSLFSSSAASK